MGPGSRGPSPRRREGPLHSEAGGVSQQLTTISGRVCKVDLSWSAGDRVSGRYMARDRMSSDVGISWCRCSSSHCEGEVNTRPHLLASAPHL